MAIACSGDRAPCSPRRILSISSRTNSPACVVGAFPWRRSLRARSIVVFSGIVSSPLFAVDHVGNLVEVRIDLVRQPVEVAPLLAELGRVMRLRQKIAVLPLH